MQLKFLHLFASKAQAVSISLVLAFSLVFLFIYAKKYEETNRENLTAISAQTMSYLGADVLRELAPSINAVEAASGILGKVPREYLREIFKGMTVSNPNTYDVYYGSAEGEFFEYGSDWKINEDREAENWDYTEGSWFIEAKQTKGKIIITEPYRDIDSKRLVFTVAKAVESSEGQFKGVVAADVFHDVLDSIVSARKITKDGASYILDANGFYLAGKELGSNFFDDFVNNFTKEQVLLDKDSIFLGEKDYLAVSHLMGMDWFIVSKGSLTALDKNSAFSILTVIAIVAIIGIFWSLTVTASVYEALRRKHKKEMLEEKKFARSLLSVKKSHYQEMEEMQNMLRALHHDFKYHIRVINELSQANHINEIKQYLADFKEKMPEGDFHYYCSNQIINALLSSYAKRCKELNVQYKVSFELPETFSMPDYDVCIILGNLLENALEACQKIETGREIELAIKHEVSQLSIMAKNSFNGIAKKKGGKLMSSKKDGGLGLPEIHAVVDSYDGHFTTDWDESKFTVYVALNLG